jgi:hypothetical protein
MKKFAFALAAAATVAAAMPAMAATVIDQSQTASSGGFAYLNQTDRASQTFVAGYNNSVGAGIFLSPGFGSASGTVTLSILNGLPGAGGQVIATGAATGTGNSWVDVSWAQTALVIGQTYYLSASSAASLVVGYASGDKYVKGAAYFGSSSYAPYGYDLTFRTYANAAAAAVPEPATWGMMILGFGMIGAAARSRKVKTTVKFA